MHCDKIHTLLIYVIYVVFYFSHTKAKKKNKAKTKQNTDGFSSDKSTNEDLQKQFECEIPQKKDELSKMMFVYGCLIQFPCFWVRLPSQNAHQMQPAVMTGPWNDTEMELTASYIQRLPNPGAQKQVCVILCVCLCVCVFFF